MMAGNIEDLLTRLERVVARLNEAYGITPDADEAEGPPPVDWQGFVGEHPELQPDPLKFTDDELVAALAEAERLDLEYDRQWVKTPEDRARLEAHQRAHPGVCSSAVADVIAGRPFFLNDGYADSVVPRPTKGDVIRVGRALGRLNRAGRIALTSKTWEHKAWSAARVETS